MVSSPEHHVANPTREASHKSEPPRTQITGGITKRTYDEAQDTVTWLGAGFAGSCSQCSADK